MRGFGTTVPLPMPEAKKAVRDALAREGFGVLTEIDVAATLQARLGVERPPLRILGACNATFANLALNIDPSIALVLPCKVAVDETDGGTCVRIVAQRDLTDDSPFEDVADDAATKPQPAVDEMHEAPR